MKFLDDPMGDVMDIMIMTTLWIGSASHLFTWLFILFDSLDYARKDPEPEFAEDGPCAEGLAGDDFLRPLTADEEFQMDFTDLHYDLLHCFPPDLYGDGQPVRCPVLQPANAPPVPAMNKGASKHWWRITEMIVDENDRIKQERRDRIGRSDRLNASRAGARA